jgi:hypothetical protein
MSLKSLRAYVHTGMMAYWFQPRLISYDTVFFSHNKPVSVRLISPKTNQQPCIETAKSISMCTLVLCCDIVLTVEQISELAMCHGNSTPPDLSRYFIFLFSKKWNHAWHPSQGHGNCQVPFILLFAHDLTGHACLLCLFILFSPEVNNTYYLEFEGFVVVMNNAHA